MPLLQPALIAALGCVFSCSIALTPAAAATAANPTAAVAETYRFDIPEGPLDAALAAFQDVTGASVAVPNGASIEGLWTPGVAGVHTAERALAVLLTGTGLRARLSGVGAYRLDVHVADEGIQVSARAPYEGTASDTATRTRTPLRDVPQAITVVTRSMIADQSMQTLADVVRYVPGIGASQGEGNRDAAVFRGIGSTADFFVDGVRDDVQYFRDLYNVERVEAIKGPNAMIFGRGGAGGLINRTTRQADWTNTREVTLQAGSFDNRRATFDAGHRFGNRAAGRAAAVYENSGSYRDGVELERYGINPTAAFALGSGTILRASYEHFHDGRTADRGVPSWNGVPFETEPSTFFGSPADSRSRATINSVAASLDHRFNRNVSLRNRTRFAVYDKFYQNVYAGGPVTADGLTVPLAAYNSGNDRQNLFTQTDLTVAGLTGRIRHTVLVGTEFGRQVTGNFRETGFFGDVTRELVPVDNPRPTTPLTFRQVPTDADNHGTATVAAAYAQDQVEFSPHLQAIVGVRYDQFEVDFRNNRTGDVFGSTDGLMSPRAGLIVKPAQEVSLYTSYSLTYVPRAGEQLGSLTLSNRALEPEQFRNYEVGVKWDVLPLLSWTAAVYRLDRTNVVVPDPVDPTRSLLVDGQRTRGVELGISGAVTGAWRIMGGYAFQDGEITETLSPSAPAGATLAQLPRHTFSLWNRYDFTPRWGAGLGIVQRSELFASTDNAVVVPSFVRLDGAVFATLTPRLQAQLNIENALNEGYYASVHNNFNILPGSPRAVRLTLTTRF